MADKDIQAQVDEFVALPRAERRKLFPTLPKEVKLRARKIIEARRGIAYRAEGGVKVLTKEGYIDQILKQTEKLNDLPRRAEVLKERIADQKKQLLENWGEDALAEAEAALEAQANQ